MFDRSRDLIGLANDALSRNHPVPARPVPVEPLNDAAASIRKKSATHLPSRDFHWATLFGRR